MYRIAHQSLVDYVHGNATATLPAEERRRSQRLWRLPSSPNMTGFSIRDLGRALILTCGAMRGAIWRKPVRADSLVCVIS